MVAPELFEAPLTLVCETVHAKVVPPVPLLKLTVVVAPEHKLCAVGVAVIVGIGLTVTVAVTGVPAQPPALGVIVYTAVPLLAVVAFKVCAIVVPELFEAPLTLVCETIHAKVAPPVLLLNAIEVAVPEQMLCELGVAVAVGAGLTVTVTVTAEPAQVPALGVIV
jgi:hypothetical protein